VLFTPSELAARLTLLTWISTRERILQPAWNG